MTAYSKSSDETRLTKDEMEAIREGVRKRDSLKPDLAKRLLLHVATLEMDLASAKVKLRQAQQPELAGDTA